MRFSASLLPPPRSCTIKVNGEALRKNTDNAFIQLAAIRKILAALINLHLAHTKPRFATGYIYPKRSFPPSPAVFNTHSTGSMGAV
jgi:hypothetical protein